MADERPRPGLGNLSGLSWLRQLKLVSCPAEHQEHAAHLPCHRCQLTGLNTSCQLPIACAWQAEAQPCCALQSTRRMRGTYHATNAWLTWFMFSLLLFLSLLVDVVWVDGINGLRFIFQCALWALAAGAGSARPWFRQLLL